MDYESRDTLAKAYEFLKIQQEQIHAHTDAIEALLKTLVTSDPKTHAKYAAAMADLAQSESAKEHAQVIGMIDSVIATLRSGHMGDA